MKRASDGCNRPSRICGGPRIWQSAAEAVRLAREIVTYVTDRLGRMEG
ncbi:hypothetical protein [Candidatus Methylomirabilis sp.]